MPQKTTANDLLADEVERQYADEDRRKMITTNALAECREIKKRMELRAARIRQLVAQKGQVVMPEVLDSTRQGTS